MFIILTNRIIDIKIYDGDVIPYDAELILINNELTSKDVDSRCFLKIFEDPQVYYRKFQKAISELYDWAISLEEQEVY